MITDANCTKCITVFLKAKVDEVINMISQKDVILVSVTFTVKSSCPKL